MSGYNNLKRESLRNRRDTVGSRAMVESKHSPFGRGSRWPIAKRRGDAGVASRARMHR